MLRFLFIFLLMSPFFQLNAEELSISAFSNYGVYAPWESEPENQSISIDHKRGFAGRIAWHTTDELRLEFYYALNEVELDIFPPLELNYEIETYQLGAAKTISGGVLNEYFGAGLGITRFSPKFLRGGTQDDLSVSLFGGVEIEVNEFLALVVDARMQLVFLDSATRILCAKGCEIDIRSEQWSHIQLNAGFTFRF